MEEIFEIRSYKTDKLSGCSRMKGGLGVSRWNFTSGVQGKAPVGNLGAVPRRWSFFVNKWLDFDVLEEKISKMAKIANQKLG